MFRKKDRSGYKPECADTNPNELPGVKAKSFILPYAGGQTYFYNFCNTDIQCNLAGHICQRAWCVSWVCLYGQFYTELSSNILQKFHYGISATADHCRSTCKTDISDSVYKTQRWKMSK